jgi:hypothetical protein
MKLNPTVKEFLDAKPGLTMLGLSWAMWWRIQLAIGLVFAAASLGLIILSAILTAVS